MFANMPSISKRHRAERIELSLELRFKASASVLLAFVETV